MRRKRICHTGSLDVSDDGSGLVVHELDAHLGDTTTGAYQHQHVSLYSPVNPYLLLIDRNNFSAWGAVCVVRAEFLEIVVIQTHRRGKQEPNFNILQASCDMSGEERMGFVFVPVRPRTRVTLTSLTGAFEESIVKFVLLYLSTGDVWC